MARISQPAGEKTKRTQQLLAAHPKVESTAFVDGVGEKGEEKKETPNARTHPLYAPE
jgi:hypothetical protein